jgi:hypothetical protein
MPEMFSLLNVRTGQAEINELTSKGILPVLHDFETKPKEMEALQDEAHPFLMGKVSAVVNTELSAKEIVDEIIAGAVERLNAGSAALVSKSKI